MVNSKIFILHANLYKYNKKDYVKIQKSLKDPKGSFFLCKPMVDLIQLILN